MKKWLTPVLVVLSVLVIAACTSTSQIIAMGLRVQVVQIDRAADGSLQATVRVTNPNVVPYLIDHSAHKISLNSQVIGTVIDSSRLGLAAGRSEDRKLPVTAVTPVGSQIVAAAVGQTAVPYRVDSAVWLLVVDDQIEKASLSGTGAVAVAGK